MGVGRVVREVAEVGSFSSSIVAIVVRWKGGGG